MQSKYIKIIIALALIVALCLAIFVSSASAVPAPIIIGGAGIAIGGLAWAISNAFGVDMDLSQFNTQELQDFIDPYYNVITTLNSSDMTFIKGLRSGYDALQLSITAFNALREGVTNLISTNNIQDNSQTTFTSPNTAPDGTLIGTVLATGYLPATAGATLTLSYGDYNISLVRTSDATFTESFYYKNNLINTMNVNYGLNSNYSMRLFNISNLYAIQLWQGDNPYSMNQSSYFTMEGTVTAGSTIPYESGTIDTSFGSTALQNITVVFPETVLPSTATIDQIMQAINNLALNDSSDVTLEIDVGPGPGPGPEPQPIPTTPLGEVPFDEWYDLYGGNVQEILDQIQSNQEEIWNDIINQAFEDAGYTDATEGITDLIGLQTDIDETLQDGIVYGSRTADATEDISTELTNVGDDVEDIKDDVVIIVDEMGDVIDVLEGIDAQEYINGQSLGDISADTTAISTNVSDMADDLSDVKDAVLPIPQTLTDVSTDISTLTDTADDIKDAVLPLPDLMSDTKDAVEDMTDTLTDTLTDTKDAIITEIQDATTTLTDDIPNINDICENIDEAPLKDTDTGVTRLPNLILPYITDLRSALGIWHYVVTWTGQISTVFTWILGVITGTAIMTPIYAAVAGYIVIHVYRRMCN